MKKTCLKLGIILVIIAIVIESILLVKARTYKVQNPIATIQIEGYDKSIKIELDPQSAPNAVANFVKLANSGFYTDFTMSIESNRILGDTSMQKAKLSNIVDQPTQDYVYGIKGDFIANGVDNLIKHKKGVITMERDDYSYFGYTEEGYNSANCNFCILTEDIENYDGQYASFGKVVDGMEVLDAIAASRTEVNSNDGSVDITDTETASNENSDENVNGEATGNDESKENTIKIKSITVDTFGVDYGVPETVNYEANFEKVNEAYSQIFGGNTTVTPSEE